MSSARSIGGAVLAVALLAGTTAVTHAADPVVTLHLATPEDPDRPSQTFIDAFTAEVASRSNGAIGVDVIYAAGGHESDKEPVTAHRVLDGDVELAIIPSRTWTDVGVTGYQALMAPFLIDNDGLLRAVTADPTVLQPMVDGLADQGLIGLSVWPESLRELFTFDENGAPLVQPGDLTGQTMFVTGSGLQRHIMETLGAKTNSDFPPDALVQDGTLRGAEYSLAYYNLYLPATVTADVVFYPKVQTLVAEDAAWSRLTEEQQQVIRQAAADAHDAQLATLRDTADLVAEFCAQGGRAVLAGDANVAAFRLAAEPIYVEMRRDPATAAAIDAITALKETTDPGKPRQACEPAPQPTAEPVASGPAIGLVPDGTYVVSHTKQQLADAGLNAMDASNNAGKITWRFNGTTGSSTIDHPNGYHEVCDVTYTALGDRVRMDMKCGGRVDFRWSLQGDQLSVTVVDTDSGTEYDRTALQGIFGGPLTKVE